MNQFALSYTVLRPEDLTIFHSLMEAWEGRQVADATWILKRNDGCTCQTIMDDLREHITIDNEISVIEITPAH